MSTKFQSPATVGFMICIAMIVLAKLASRLIVLGSLYFLAGCQVLAPIVVRFVKDQLGELVPVDSQTHQNVDYFSDLPPGIVDEIRSEDLGSQAHQEPDLIAVASTEQVVESVLSALAKPKRGRKPKLDQGSQAHQNNIDQTENKIISRPKKLSKKEQAAKDAWEDRQVMTDFQDQASWLGV